MRRTADTAFAVTAERNKYTSKYCFLTRRQLICMCEVASRAHSPFAFFSTSFRTLCTTSRTRNGFSFFQRTLVPSWRVLVNMPTRAAVLCMIASAACMISASFTLSFSAMHASCS